ncbi:MAG: hypothetical protein JSV38_15670, partial [Desulfobacterales bacterium]
CFAVLLNLFINGLCLRAHADIPAIEREALIALYNSTNGDSWRNKTNWKTPPLHTDGFAMPGTECIWVGVLCNSENTAVDELKFGNNKLTGSIPPELSNLVNTRWLDLSNNQLTGSIPPELGNLSYMYHLSLNSNQFTGSIPHKLGNLSRLEDLYLQTNQLRG